MRGEPTERDVGAFNWSQSRDITADGSKVLVDAIVPGEPTHAFLCRPWWSAVAPLRRLARHTLTGRTLGRRLHRRSQRPHPGWSGRVPRAARPIRNWRELV